MRDRLAADDPGERASAAAELNDRAGSEPAAVAGYVPALVDLAGEGFGRPDGDRAARYAAATLRRLAAAGHLPVGDALDTLRAGVADDDSPSATVGGLLGIGGDEGDDEPAEAELHRAAGVLARVGESQAGDVDVETLVAALDREETRRPAARALFRVSRHVDREGDDGPLADATDRLLELLAADDPAVRGDAVAVLGRERFAEHDFPPYFGAIVDRLSDPDPAVRQTVLGVLGRNSPNWPSALSAADLDDLIGRVADREDDSDPTVRRRATSLQADLVGEALDRLVRRAVEPGLAGGDRAAEAVADAAATDRGTARLAANLATEAADFRGDEALRDDLHDRIAARHDAYGDAAALRAAADDDRGAVGTDASEGLLTALVDLAEAHGPVD